MIAYSIVELNGTALNTNWFRWFFGDCDTESRRLLLSNKRPKAGLLDRVALSCHTPFTRYSRLSNGFDNRFDNRLYRVNGASQRARWFYKRPCLHVRHQE